MSDPLAIEQESGIEPAMPGRAVVENLGSAARRLGFVSEEQINEAVATQVAYANDGLRKKIGEVLVEKKYLSADQLDLIVKTQTVSKKRIGDYELIAKLGEGGMGAVYKARQMSMDRVVAVKVLSPTHAQNPDYRNRFESEAKAVARLNHPNIVTGIDAGHSDGFYYFAMEFVDGETMGQLMKHSGGKLDEREALKYIRQITEALHHAHTNNLLHRDVKPDNILIDKKRGVAKLADLGLARDAVTSDCGATRTGQAVGTPFYMSPEQARGKELSPSTDFYSLGGTLYHAVTGEIPFTGATAAMIMARHITDPVPNPRIVAPKLSSATAKLIVKCLQKAPSDRYQNATTLLADIDVILNGSKAGEAPAIAAAQPTKSRPTTAKFMKEAPAEPKPGAALRKRRFRRTRDDSSSLLIILLVVGIAAIALIYAVTSAKPEKPKRKTPVTAQ
ncbi:MAG: serine/threonine-protein kinase [Planctomycetota bacterium]